MGKGGAKCSVEKIAKSGIFITNILFLALGIVIIISAAVALSEAKQFEKSAILFELANTSVACGVLLGTGIACVTVALMGMLGAYKRYPTLLKLYIVLMFLILMLQMAMGIYIKRTDVVGIIGPEFLTDTPTAQEQRIAFQKYLECCGWDHPVHDNIALNDPYCPYYEPPSMATCADATEGWMNQYAEPVAALAIALAVLELMALMPTCYIVMTAKSDSDDYFDNPFHY
eukprot:gb/GEZN01008729.1/.p1 GENE.gb/GEZN01008729.1/~~gb/GEZN01008729.1/.p1  ORF type:complete len:229 (+),score=28.72 gb/GEZN01008729.1/:80-766(+)